jgi:hypothetical protein
MGPLPSLTSVPTVPIYHATSWGLRRVAIIDIDAHFGNGTAELVRGDSEAFFARWVRVRVIWEREGGGGGALSERSRTELRFV